MWYNHLATHSGNGIVFVTPAEARFIQSGDVLAVDRAIRDRLTNTQHPYRWAFIPVNNNPDESVGGSHWSLLIYDYKRKVYYHLDSASRTNQAIASDVVDTLRRVLPGKLEEVPVFQQQNGADCGVHLLFNTELFLRKVRNQGPPVAFTEPQDAANTRAVIRNFIRQQ